MNNGLHTVGCWLIPIAKFRRNLKNSFLGAIVLHARAITSTNHRQPAGQPAACNLNLRSHDSAAEFSRSVLLFISYCAPAYVGIAQQRSATVCAAGAKMGRLHVLGLVACALGGLALELTRGQGNESSFPAGWNGEARKPPMGWRSWWVVSARNKPSPP
mgnify:CR=1 FL=1